MDECGDEFDVVDHEKSLGKVDCHGKCAHKGWLRNSWLFYIT